MTEPIGDGTSWPMPRDGVLTERLWLRPLSVGDLEDLVLLHSDPEVMRGSSGLPVPRTHAETADWLRRALLAPAVLGCGHVRVEDATTGEFLGRCGLRSGGDRPGVEVTYAFLQAAWGRGIATEAARTVLDRGRDAGLTRVVAEVVMGNVASQRVLRKLGMRPLVEPTTGGALRYEVDLSLTEATTRW